MGTHVRTGRVPADYRTYLEGKLSQAKRRIKSSDAATGIAVVSVAWVSYVLLLVMLDHIVELPAWIRTLLLVAMIVATGAVLVLRVVYPAFRRVNGLFAAKTVEAVDPKMKNSVLSWVEISEKSESLPNPVLRSIESRAAVDLSRVRIEDAIQPRYVLTSMYILAGVVIAFCLFSFLTTKSFGTSVQRVLFPFAGVAPPTATQLSIHFEPSAGELTEPDSIPVGGSMVFRAYVERGNPDAVIAYVRLEGEDYESPHDLIRTQAGSREFVLALHQRQRTFDIRFIADDFSSRSYRVRVTPSPTVVDWMITYEPPAYTGQAAFTSPTPEVDALEGTKVRVEATTNLPLEPGSNRLDLRMGNVESTSPMLLVDGSSNRLSGEFTLTGDGFYSLAIKDSEGRTPDFRPNYSIRMRKDLPPSIQFEAPADKEVELPANASLVLRANIADDFGLQKVQVKVRHGEGGEILFSRDYPELGGQIGTSLAATDDIDLAAHDLKAGQILEYWIEAEDNKRPVSNAVSTQRDRRIVKIVEPKPKNENAQKPDDGKQQKPQNQDKKDSQDKAQDQPKEGEKGESQPQDAQQGDENQQGAEGQQGEQKQQSAGEGSGEPSNGQGNSEQRESSAESSNQPGQSESESGMDEGDREAVQKLEDYFDGKEQKNDGNEEENPSEKSAKSGEKKQQGSTESDDKESKEDTADQNKSTSNDQQEGEEKQASGQQEEKEGSSSDDKSAPSREGQAPNKSDAGRKDSDSPAPMNDPSKSAEEQQAKKQAGENQSGEKESGEKSTGENASGEKPSGEKQSGEKAGENPSGEKDSGEKQSGEKESGEKKTGDKQSGDKQIQQQGEKEDSKSTEQARDEPSDPKASESSKESADPKQGEGSKEKKAKDRKEPADAQDQEQGSSGADSKPQESKQAESGAGKQGEGDKERPDAAQPGDPSQKDNGKEGQSAKDDAPRPESESKEEQKNQDASHKEGPDKSSAASAANSDGQSNQGESSTSGQSSTGSPSEEKGDNSNSTGQQKGDGQSEGPGDKKAAEKSPGQDGQAPSEETKNPSDASEQASQSEKGSAEESKPENASKEEGNSSGEKSDEAKQGESKPGDEAADGKPGDNPGDPSNSSKDNSQSGEGKRNPKGGGAVDPNKVSEEEVTGDGEIVDNSGDEANVDDKKKGSELVLKKLEEELKKKKVDPELLKRMGWTQKDAREFYDRMRQQAAEEKAAPITSDKREGFGKGSELRGRSERASGKRKDDAQDLETGRKTAVPPELRKRFEAYTKSLSKKGSD